MFPRLPVYDDINNDSVIDTKCNTSAYGCLNSHVTTKNFEIDGLPNFLSYGAPQLTGFSLQNRRDFLRISGEQRRKRGERVASASCVREEER